ncbi:zincin-like metallopeptidase domain-containing protein [Bradyrhizobium sp. ARR65]|uniref:ArdC family protein n=2 Tax=Bradyrhizobium sp. ARR65 TaxID=1040989 RepID=UPI000465B3E5|nr:zincin-like metallopeptidase domain-containing protein [Bradyrhizobium sp. ARR65]
MRDVYNRVTKQIISSLETGTRPWIRPWKVDNSSGSIQRPLRSNGIAYRGINVLLLWSEAFVKGYSNPTWITFKQALDLGGYVRKGERASPVFFSSTYSRAAADDATGEEIEHTSSFLRSYSVFNVEQTECLPSSFYQRPHHIIDEGQRLSRVEGFIAATHAQVEHGGSQAYYAPTVDRIQMPLFVTFHDPLDYYATLIHELIHWTRHKNRLNREFGQQRFGDRAYAMEELVAELGAAFVSADLNLTPEIRDDHASYIASWLEVLQQDKRAIFAAAAHAQRASDYLHSLQRSLADHPQTPALTGTSV